MTTCAMATTATTMTVTTTKSIAVTFMNAAAEEMALAICAANRWSVVVAWGCYSKDAAVCFTAGDECNQAK